MTLTNQIFQEIENNQQLRKQGKYIAIPWINLPKLSNVVPGIQRGRYVMITANSKVKV